MVLWDVNLLLYASIPQSEHFGRCRPLLQRLVDGDEHFAVSELILAAFVRIGTNPRVFKPPADPAETFAICRALREHPQAVQLTPGKRHWEIFEDLVLGTGLHGSDTTDAYLAALALEHGCEFWTADNHFARFPGLRWHNPLTGERA